MRRIEIFDTTLRDGAQASGISFSVSDKLKLIELIDRFGIDVIEAGNPASNPKDAELFRLLKDRKYNGTICAMTSTCKVGSRVSDDPGLIATLESGAKCVSLVGKASYLHIKKVLKTGRRENSRIISESVRFFAGRGIRVIFYAEHFFDGYREMPSAALGAIGAAYEAGAESVVLCDTNGGTLPSEIRTSVTAVKKAFPELRIGIHCHNDIGMAAASSVAAIEEGADQLHGTFLGLGERCGNASLSTLIPTLIFKLGASLTCAPNVSQITALSRSIADLANCSPDPREPYVGTAAFSHKAGMHIDAVSKLPESFEHIDPAAVGNSRSALVGEFSGKSAVYEKLKRLDSSIEKDSPIVQKFLDRIKSREQKGYFYENADASLKLELYRVLGKKREFFTLKTFKLMLGEPDITSGDGSSASALIKISVDGEEEITAAEGNGPVNAMDGALRKALSRFYPEVSEVRLVDYKVRVLDSESATGASVRVLIETTNGRQSWHTVGVSTDIIKASWKALIDSVEYYLMDICDKVNK